MLCCFVVWCGACAVLLTPQGPPSRRCSMYSRHSKETSASARLHVVHAEGGRRMSHPNACEVKKQTWQSALPHKGKQHLLQLEQMVQSNISAQACALQNLTETNELTELGFTTRFKFQTHIRNRLPSKNSREHICKIAASILTADLTRGSVSVRAAACGDVCGAGGADVTSAV